MGVWDKISNAVKSVTTSLATPVVLGYQEATENAAVIHSIEETNELEQEDLFTNSKDLVSYDVGTIELTEKREKQAKKLAKVNEARRARGQKPLYKL